MVQGVKEGLDLDPSKLQAEIDTYISRTPKSAELQKQAESYLPGGSSRGTSYFDPYPHFIERGDGPYIVDVDEIISPNEPCLIINILFLPTSQA